MTLRGVKKHNFRGCQNSVDYIKNDDCIVKLDVFGVCDDSASQFARYLTLMAVKINLSVKYQHKINFNCKI